MVLLINYLLWKVSGKNVEFETSHAQETSCIHNELPSLEGNEKNIEVENVSLVADSLPTSEGNEDCIGVLVATFPGNMVSRMMEFVNHSFQEILEIVNNSSPRELILKNKEIHNSLSVLQSMVTLAPDLRTKVENFCHVVTKVLSTSKDLLSHQAEIAKGSGIDELKYREAVSRYKKCLDRINAIHERQADMVVNCSEITSRMIDLSAELKEAECHVANLRHQLVEEQQKDEALKAEKSALDRELMECKEQEAQLKTHKLEAGEEQMKAHEARVASYENLLSSYEQRHQLFKDI
uniref:Uncharacterized protein n=1 Tax=Nelumbo nucifera TaxID=4432 RepID=A0A822Z7H1_NELNU|nr:TPA_asm: hypothetical protein HUJ06_013728 [Nelumbo nucifera]